jgi:hypothetical protein
VTRSWLPLLLALQVLLLACRPGAPAPAETAADDRKSVPTAEPVQALSPADAADLVRASMQGFLEARSFQASMQLEGAQAMSSDMEFAAPDRYRIRLPVGTQVIIGNTMYLDMQGQRSQVPIPPDTISQWRDPLQIKQNLGGLSAEFLGSEDLNGTPARKFLVRNTQPEAAEFTYWIGSDGLPLQLRHQGRGESGDYVMTLRYWRYNDPSISVSPPH